MPLFPYFYCKDVQKGGNTSQSDSDDQEEVKGAAANATGSVGRSNSLSSLKLEDVAPPADVVPSLFGGKKTLGGSNRYEKIQVAFKSSIRLEHEGDQAKPTGRSEYHLDIAFDNISKI